VLCCDYSRAPAKKTRFIVLPLQVKDRIASRRKSIRDFLINREFTLIPLSGGDNRRISFIPLLKSRKAMTLTPVSENVKQMCRHRCILMLAILLVNSIKSLSSAKTKMNSRAEIPWSLREARSTVSPHELKKTTKLSSESLNFKNSQCVFVQNILYYKKRCFEIQIFCIHFWFPIY
jgi:hypothetical protein